jgi:hypothetical protein
MTDVSFEALVKGLREHARGLADHEHAAVELLIWKESWLRRPDFIAACVTQLGRGHGALIDWVKAREFHDRAWAAAAPASSSEWKILDLAVGLGGCEYSWLLGMGYAHKRAIVDAVETAMGLAEAP